MYLVERLNEAGLCDAQLMKTPIQVDIKRGPNEARQLWDFAHAVRDHFRRNPATTDYVLCADFIADFERGQVGGVHFVLSDARGEWVIVDLQNSHQEDFKKIRPKSAEDCARLVKRRFETYLQGS